MTHINTPWKPPAPPMTRPRAKSEIPFHPSSSGPIDTPFLRASSVMPPPSSTTAGMTTFQNDTANHSMVPLSGAMYQLNQPFLGPPGAPNHPVQVKTERITPSPPHIKLELPPTPESRPKRLQQSQGLMLPPDIRAPSAIADISAKSLGKRKAQNDQYDNGHQGRFPRFTSPQDIKQERGSSILSDIKPSLAIPILPTPLPSKRFKKRPTSKAVLIPVEQLPVFPLPPLPAIEDHELLKQVFTHQSLFERARGKFEDAVDSPAKHYEKLEHVGDAILGFVVTTWLHESRPNLTIGTATKLKAHLVSNATLSHLSGLYNLPQRLNGDPELLPVLRAQTDVRAALLEAYIAALYFSFPIEERLSTGIKTIDTWLREMYEPLHDFFYNYMKKEYEQHHSTVGATLDGRVEVQSEAEIARIDKASQGMAILVQMYCTNQDRELRWEDEKFETNVGSLWKMQCTVDGIELGEGVRPFKKAAKNVAAWEAAKKLGITDEA
ncbi:hypothetical protein IAU59_000929 [Kwoniella sp. CBS 9459]